MAKPFKTIDEQCTLLCSRNLTFTKTEDAKRFLLTNNYYNVVNCYGKFFIDHGDVFIDGTNFNELTCVHYFDKEIKNILFKYIIEIEKRLKSIIAYYFSEAHQGDPYPYLYTHNFNSNNILKVAPLISSLSNIIKKYSTALTNNSIKHYIHVHKSVPLWIICNYMSFGQIVLFYKNMKRPEQNKVAKEFSAILNESLGRNDIKLQVKHVISYLDNLLEIRNLVAHNNKVLGYKCKQNTLYIKELHSNYNANPNSPRQSVFDIFIVMRCFLDKNQYIEMHNTVHKRIKNLKKNIKTIDPDKILDSLGFSQIWYDNGKIPQK
ncbi:Abi family protein [Beduini massiliensis]|uniref:Abi family protein n=1 Tax=Beduini massiliensis TaxID=1585974 RepID=UPI00059AB38E|nr:Abi family protein [Beduini massiliensis]